MKPLFDVNSLTLTGVECRALRALLCLERRHVVLIQENVAEPEAPPLPAARVMQWERSKGRGYPVHLVSVLLSMERAVATLADEMVAELRESGAVQRPLGHRRIVARLRLPDHGLTFAGWALEKLDADGGDLWQCLCDAAVGRALLQGYAESIPAAVELDRDPDGQAAPANPPA